MKKINTFASDHLKMEYTAIKRPPFLLSGTCQGAGNPMILLHGLFGSGDNLRGIAKRLSPFFKIYSPDLRNHGNSLKAEYFNYSVMAEDVKQFMRHHNLKKTVMVGHSMGGKVAMRLSSLYPDCIEKLVVLDIAPKAYSVKQRSFFHGLLDLDLSVFSRLKQIFDELSKQTSDISLCRMMMKNIKRDTNGQYQWTINLKAILDNIDHIGMDPGARIQSTIPALFIRGEHSDFIDGRDTNRILSFFPKATIKTMTGTSHWIHMDAPDRLAEMIVSFV